MFEGKIVRFNKQRGFGFINDGEDDIFFFADSILNRDDFYIQDGLDVHFEIAPGYKGPQAVNITINEGVA
ncbi:cold-shock protein [Companilactobacillus sp.]|jgi:CspA family cold shock protein|uniref:cold-shock protein n=1 Tax=Companilactobacillus sp. TaxID=2767905 RepID=UPI0025B8E7AE|nr:cold shock domain-containing protein [Companilactobacillus sp.]MCH4008437.1 cold shock domain-containing protein [Companilactobacillus sp.]MCH4051384.1 cold shock domain-containing protein [Companilactobacillus sp.]MCH4076380.1 cold shock domain-containing protein [Companilactobacillus sp.]MCH4124955.1 cold shock domain-containing protein [Companilactobacillus sp.]MCH4131497.1 cold shock domain-containing protein [Companilactobacillus sp.]